ncbi:MAG: putative sulfate exporter family transporter [Burkholderiaceae bacterium]
MPTDLQTPPLTLHRLDQMLAQSALSYAQHTAIVDGPTRLSYAELDAAVSRTANLLLSHGLGAGDRVALDALNGAEFVVAYYAILRAGGVVVPLNVLIGASLLAERLEDSGAALLVCVAGPDGLPAATTAHTAAGRVASCREVIVIGSGGASLDSLTRTQPVTVSPGAVGVDDTAVISFHRRLPGRPNGVVLTHAAMLHNIASITNTVYGKPTTPDVHLVTLPLFHMVTQAMQLHPGIASGATLVLMPRFEPDTALRLMAAEQVSILVAAPSMLWALASAAEQQPAAQRAARAALRLVCSQLAPLPAAVQSAVEQQLGVLPVEGFGQTETGMVCLHARPGDIRPESVGEPTAGVEVRVVNSNGAVVAGPATGELQVRGPGLMREYYRNPEATAATIQEGWLRTGAVVRRAEDGHYVMVDRPIHMVVRGGLTVYRRTVEEAMLTHPAITATQVIAVPHARHGEELQTVIERDPKAVISEAELLEWAREQLPGLTGTDVQLIETPPGASRIERSKNVAVQLMPGVAVAAAGTALAFIINRFVPFLSPLTAGVLLGVVLANTGLLTSRITLGLSVSTRRLLRAGVVFLGLQLSLLDVIGLGVPLLAVVVVTVIFGFVVTRWVGERLGLSRDLSLLTAAGFSICGASAIAAMQGASDATEDEVATAIALVTIFGTVALFGWPMLQHVLLLGNEAYGAWAGASVHEVAQVVAAASPAGEESLATAVVVKLARVIMLAPLVAMVAYLARQRSKADQTAGAKKLPLVPLFVLGFLAMVVVRTTGVLPQGLLDGMKILTTAMLAAALFGLGTGVKVRVLLATGPQALVLGAISTVLIAVVAYVGVLLAVGTV